jgi:hypothetical protein
MNKKGHVQERSKIPQRQCSWRLILAKCHLEINNSDHEM